MTFTTNFKPSRTARKKVCKRCGQPATFGRYCSRSCAVKAGLDRPRRPKACPSCGVAFVPRWWGRKQRWTKYCSERCYRIEQAKQYAQIDATCVWCGKIFKRNRAMLKRSAPNVFCSRECGHRHHVGERHHAYRGERDPNRGAKWEVLAETIRARDGFVCRKCGKTQTENGRRLDVDHVIPWRAFKPNEKANANDMRNLVTLCADCHKQKTQQAERKWLRGDVLAMEQYKRDVGLAELGEMDR